MDLGGFFKPKTGDTPSQSTPNKPCAIPMLNQVKSATKGATEVFSGVTSHVYTSLRMLGSKNVGIRFGHGHAVKPSGVLKQIQSSLVVGVIKMMTKFGMIPNIPFGKGALQESFQIGISTLAKNHISPGNMAEQVTQDLAVSQLTQIGSCFKSTTFKENAVGSKFGNQSDEKGGSVQAEQNIHQMVLKHERNIEELVEENKKLRQIVEDLKVPSSKLEASSEDLNDIPNSKGEDDIHKHNEQSEKREN